MNIVEQLWDWARRCPDKLALKVGGRQWTYAALVDSVAVIGRRVIQCGIAPGDRVLLVLPTSQEFVAAYYGVLATGATVVTVNTMSTERELCYFIDDGGCTLVIGWHESADAVVAAANSRDVQTWILGQDPVVDIEAVSFSPIACKDDDVAVLLYTSGTTGAPKGAELTFGNLELCASTVGERLQLTPEDRVGTALPLFHVYGQVVVMGSALQHGAALYLIRPFSGAAVVGLVAREAITVLAGVPTMWNDMLQAVGADGNGHFSRLRIALSGGAGLPREVARAFSQRFDCALLEGYGLSEATGVATMNSPEGVTKEGSVGRALPGLEIAVVDPTANPAPVGELGEVVVRGGVIMRGYRNRPDETAKAVRDGWLFTGDIGRLDADGYLWIVDRKKDLVIRGGYNVYPREIEEVLYQHPGIREAAVIGVPDARLGEEIAAVIAFYDDEKLDGAQLRRWLAKHLAVYKVPRIYVTVDELPKGPSGKILKRAIDKGWVRACGVRVTSNPR